MDTRRVGKGVVGVGVVGAVVEAGTGCLREGEAGAMFSRRGRRRRQGGRGSAPGMVTAVGLLKITVVYGLLYP